MATDHSVSHPSIQVCGSTGAVLDFYPMASFNIGEDIGHGSFGCVKKAYHPKYNDVAIKMLNCGDKDAVEREATKMRTLCAYPTIINVHCLTHCGEGKTFGIVMEWMKLGNLKRFQKKVKIPWALRMRMLKDISEGMHYLHDHQPPIVHGDLKAENIFVQETLCVKIGDLGLSRSMQSMMTREKAGTPSHMPPEYFDPKESPNPKWDVYSFGILQYEVASEKSPFEAMKGDVSRLRWFVKEGNERPDISKINDCPLVISELMTECWDGKPANRPDFKDVKMRIQDAYRRDFEKLINREIIEVHRQLHSTTEIDAKKVVVNEEQICELRTENGGPLPAGNVGFVTHPIQELRQDNQHATAAIHDTQTTTPGTPCSQTATPVMNGRLIHTAATTVIHDTHTAIPATSDIQTATPATSGIQTAIPATSGIQTAIPATSGIQTATPATSDIQTATPATSDIQTATPAISDIRTATPVISDIQTETPATSCIQTATPATSGIQTATPAASGIQTATPATSGIQTEKSDTTHVFPYSTGRRASVESPVIINGFKEINNNDIRCVKKHLRKNMFRELGREFDLTEAEMDAIEEDNRYYGEQVHELIHKWRQKKGSRTRHDLAKCLKELDLTIIKELNKLDL